LYLLAVAALGVSKERREVDTNTPGLGEVVGGLLSIFPEPGSKPLHDELKFLLQVGYFLSALVNKWGSADAMPRCGSST
jgi:hypothetical protein